MAEVGRKPNESRFIDKAKALEALGRYTEAIKTLNSVFRWYNASTNTWNALGALYEQVGEYKYAAMNYAKSIETMGTGNIPFEYYQKLTDLYIQAKD